MYGPWALMDNDCCQYIRNGGSHYEMIQCVWLDMTEEDQDNGAHQYCIVEMEIDLKDYSDEDKEIYLSAYGYTPESVVEEYGDAADSVIAECILENEILSDAYVIGDADSFDEAKEKIEEYINKDFTV